MVSLNSTEEDIRAYYSMPEGEVPATAYERNKVGELSGRIKSESSASKGSDVHIIAGRKSDQVRRIAYLTAISLMEAGSAIVPVKSQENELESPESKYPAYLIDELYLQEHRNEDEPALDINSILSWTRRNSGNGHAILLSISQETYEASLKEGISSFEGTGKQNVKESREEITVDQDGVPTFISMSFAFGPAIVSFIFAAIIGLLSIPKLYSTATSSAVSSLFFVSIGLTGLSIVFMGNSAREYHGKGRLMAMAGVILFLLEILVPVVLAFLNMLPSPDTPNISTLSTLYSSGAMLFLLFQSTGAVSFSLMPYPYANGKERAGLAISAIISVIFFLTLVIGSDTASTTHILTSSPAIPVSTLILLPPYTIPYNTFIFGFVYYLNAVYSIPTLLSAASQILFAIVYLSILLHHRKTLSTREFPRQDAQEPEDA